MARSACPALPRKPADASLWALQEGLAACKNRGQHHLTAAGRIARQGSGRWLLIDSWKLWLCSGLTSLRLTYGMRSVGMNYDKSLFGIRLSDCRALAHSLQQVWTVSA